MLPTESRAAMLRPPRNGACNQRRAEPFLRVTPPDTTPRATSGQRPHAELVVARVASHRDTQASLSWGV